MSGASHLTIPSWVLRIDRDTIFYNDERFDESHLDGDMLDRFDMATWWMPNHWVGSVRGLHVGLKLWWYRFDSAEMQ